MSDLNNNNSRVDLETPAIMALAAASKTPFKTAFKVTLGIGLARLLNFAVFAGIILAVVLAFSRLK